VQSAAVTACHKRHLEQRCRERGYTLDEVMPCVVSKDGDQWTIDTEHPAYPHVRKGGPGTELARLLKRFGIEPTPTCLCRAKAAEMDAWGPDECEKPEQMEEVISVMREEAKARGLPFLDAAGRLLVKRAIRNARKAAS
jgi:hypothetical protein